jgi:transposase InsO family protein
MSTTPNVQEKEAKHKLNLLELADNLHNVSQACRYLKVPRSEFYEIKRRFELGGFEALKNLPPIPKTHPNKKSDAVTARVLEITLEHPGWGKDRVAAQAVLEGVQVCASTVRAIWIKHDLKTRHKRWLRYEQEVQKNGFTLSEEQMKELTKLNPCLKERHVESSAPGYLLSQDTFFVGCLKGIGRIYLQTAVDTYCSFAFARLYTAKTAITAAHMLQDRILPFYQEQKLELQHILTDNGTEYCGKQTEHPFQLMLILHGIKHRRTRVATPRTNGFVERFNRTVLEEFFRGILLKKFYTSLEELQTDLDIWLEYYNYKRPHLGYRNHGNTPYMSMQSYIKNKSQKTA